MAKLVVQRGEKETEKMKANFRLYTTRLLQANGKEMDTWVKEQK